MRIVIAGGHGQIALRLERLLAKRGDEVAGIIRRPEQAGDVLAAGAEPVVCDLESASVEDVARHMEGVDAAVFAAGAGPGSGVGRKDTVDRGAAALFADAAEAAGVRRFLVVSSMGADREPPEGTDPGFAAYLRAKGAADADVRARAGLDWTILRPGRLTDDPGTDLVRLAESTGRDEVSRDDVAAVLAALLDEPGTAGLTLELIGGEVPVKDAVRAVAGGEERRSPGTAGTTPRFRRAGSRAEAGCYRSMSSAHTTKGPWLAHYANQGPFVFPVAAPGFEPGKAEPADLQSAPFGRSGTPPGFAAGRPPPGRRSVATS